MDTKNIASPSCRYSMFQDKVLGQLHATFPHPNFSPILPTNTAHAAETTKYSFVLPTSVAEFCFAILKQLVNQDTAALRKLCPNGFEAGNSSIEHSINEMQCVGFAVVQQFIKSYSIRQAALPKVPTVTRPKLRTSCAPPYPPQLEGVTWTKAECGKPAKIKRPRNAFFLFKSTLQIKRAQCQARPHFDGARQLSQDDGRAWKQMSNAEKMPFFAQAKALKQAHMAKYPRYKYMPRKKVKQGQDNMQSSGSCWDAANVIPKQDCAAAVGQHVMVSMQ